MSRILEGLLPEKVFYYFEEISKIPRESKHEERISNYLYALSREKGWHVKQDKALNIIIKKPATSGYENAQAVILQGHMDMVCEKIKDTDHDFSKDPLKLRRVDDHIYATGTTLGADNGIALAYCLAILDSEDVPHPNLEVLLTTDEEEGMSGVIALDIRELSGNILINLDSEGEGVFTVGCAGGGVVTLEIPLQKEDAKYKQAYKISVSGLFGGHSGAEIHIGRGNANKIIGRILYDLTRNHNVQIAEINGGSKDNAIPREADAVVLTDDFEALENLVNEYNDILRNELAGIDPDIELTLEKTKVKSEAIGNDAVRKILAAINLIQNGPIVRDDKMNLVIQSNNLGVIRTEDDSIKLINCPRSSKESLFEDFLNNMNQMADVLSIKCTISDIYPGWDYSENSIIKDVCSEVFEKMTKISAKIEVVHAGLECGFLLQKNENLDAISFGPDMFDVHTPNEHLSISSVGRTYEFLCEVLKNTK